MKFAHPRLHLDCSTLAGGIEPGPGGNLSRLVETAAGLLHDPGFVAFRIGRLRLGVADSRRLAREIAGALRDELVRRGAPGALRLEQDAAQETHVPSGHSTRTLLPHHDGQHCSYLTPSLLDDPGWAAGGRTFGGAGYTTTAAHKLYQGIFIVDPGEALSVTTYYDWLDVLAVVWAERHGCELAGVDPGTLARWLGGNLRAALARQVEHSCPYPSLGSQLGLAEPVWHGLSFHYAEGELSPREREQYPLAAALARACPCGRCEGETARLFCHQISAATGRNWQQFRQRWEVLFPSERFDLLFGHNLVTLHGGLAGGSARLIEPLCLVVDEPTGAEYEAWLAASWRRRLPMDVR